MPPSFLLIHCRDAERLANLASRAADRTGLAPILRSGHAVVLAAGQIKAIDLGKDRGMIVGTLFDRYGPPRQIEAFDSSRSDAICDSRGMDLISRYWGGYAAFLQGAAGLQVLRDPSAALQCYWIQETDCVAFASHCSLLYDTLAISPAIDWLGAARQLWGAGLPAKETALDGVEELLPGHALCIDDAGAGQRPIWDPWDYVTRKSHSTMADPERLRRAVETSVSAWASVCDNMLLGVSGGLDSSIVASCLAPRTGHLTCLTMATSDPDGDERPYARILCDHLGVPLEEAFYRMEDVDLDRSGAAHLPRPIGRTVALAYDAAFLRVAARHDADAFFTGNGGDNVFGFSQSGRPLADRLLAEGVSLGAWSTLADICKLTGCSPWQAFKAGVKHLAPGKRSYAWLADSRFISREIVAELAKRPLAHPWLETPDAALPGKAAHIAALLRIQQHLGCSSRSTSARIIDPLMSQPVVETCLSLPSWEWCAGGINRSLARAAFVDRLPTSLIKRRTKGGPDAFATQIIDERRSEIRDRLLGGRLRANGILDVKALEQTLADTGPNLGLEQVKVLELIDTEAWARHWEGRTSRTTARAKA